MSEMDVKLKDGMLVATLRANDVKAIQKCREFCLVLERLAPIDQRITEAAEYGAEAMQTILTLCGKSDGEVALPPEHIQETAIGAEEESE